MSRSGADSCGGSGGITTGVEHDGIREEYACPGCPDCRCPTCGGADPQEDGSGAEGITAGTRSDKLSYGGVPLCPDPFHNPASPPAKPRYRVWNSTLRHHTCVLRGGHIIAECASPTDAALIVKLLNENEERTRS